MAEIDDFWSRYSKLCLKNKIYPSKNIIKSLKNAELSCIVEPIRSEHWKFIQLALYKDNSLSKVHFASNVSPHEDEDELVQAKKAKECQYFPTPYGRTPKNINAISKAVGGLLGTSQTLTMLKLENLPLKLADAQDLASGLSKSSSLKYFSLCGCHFEEGSIATICQSLKVSRVSWLDLSFCALNLSDIEAVANVIQAHCLQRRNGMFQKTLRNQVPQFQNMPGLSRVSLNSNPLEDSGLKILTASLADDLWVKALDLQNCDIDNPGAVSLLNLASTNPSLVILDLRLNQIDDSLLSQIAKQLEQNKTGKDIKCSELPLWKSSELVRKYNNIGKVKPLKKLSTHKFKIAKRVPKSYMEKKKKLHLEAFCNRQEFFEKKVKYTYIKTSEPAREITYTVKDESSQTPPDPHDVMVQNMKHRLQNEMKIRKFLLTKYRQINLENAQLRQMLKSQNDDIYIDQETFFDVKHTFEKLKVFFDVMKKYGLWEYISMLGFDESTDVVLEDSNSQRCMKLIRDETFAAMESAAEYERDVCCNCRKLDYKHKKMEPPDNGHNCIPASNTKPLHSQVPMKEDRLNEKIAYKVLQEAIIDYNNTSPHQVLNSQFTTVQVPDNPIPWEDNMKPSGSKQSVPTSSNTDTQNLIKKISYSNIPKQLKELVSPTDFYNIVKKELERCDSNEAKKPCNPALTENYESSKSAQVNVARVKYTSSKTVKCKNEVNVTPVTDTVSSESKDGSTTKESVIDEDAPISELIAKERVKNKNKKSAKSVADSKVHKNCNRAKIKETKSLSESEETLPQSKANLSSSQTNSKKVQSKYNASSDEINSSDSIVTASDQVSSHSSLSSSSSNKSHGKLSDVTDASTFGEIESIVDTEVASEPLIPVGNLDKHFKAFVDKVTTATMNSHSSTLKDTSESKSNKSNKSAISGSSSGKDLSKKSDKSAKTSTQSQGKNKNANKHNKNRPKSNSSKSSSIPSLGDITTVSSKSLNTNSVINQISASDDSKSKGKK